ncbi:hypothetical protein [Pseudidiomarina salinarum]|uniref:hypothetical protein n=1 Tax=Pseudidiomarina salinarum TaxID=435908 RepID=UPI00068B050E|nr:hypothetical protein [Pseudidiomarina salinarum]RUO70100.1 hypothetical protein CWI79_01125 [Pseudidiomarina salinarum]
MEGHVTDKPHPVVRTSEWFVTLLILSIPVIGVIMLFVWSFNDDTNPNKKNWARAVLLWILVAFTAGLLVLLTGMFLAPGRQSLNNKFVSTCT